MDKWFCGRMKLKWMQIGKSFRVQMKKWTQMDFSPEFRMQMKKLQIEQ